MKRTIVVLAAFAGLSFWVATARSGEDEHKHKHEHKHKGHEHEGAPCEHGKHKEMGPVQVGPEHKRLHQFVGTWKVEHKMWHTPGSEPVLSTGTEVVNLVLDGRAITGEYETTGPEGTFKGYSLMTWNVMKQKYQGVWLGIFNYNGLDLTWGTYDEAENTWYWEFKMMGPGGKMMAMKSTTKMLGKDQQFTEMHATGPDGKAFKMMEFNYTRIK